ncbi:MAG: hypothetical protein AAGA56_19285 [Myxococcota bacterium]
MKTLVVLGSRHGQSVSETALRRALDGVTGFTPVDKLVDKFKIDGELRIEIGGFNPGVQLRSQLDEEGISYEVDM